MYTLTVSIAAVASSFMLPFSASSLINNTNVTPRDNKPVVTVAQAAYKPTDQQEKVQAAKPVEAAAPAPVVVTVQPGDYLAKIAEAHGTTIERLYAANTEVSDPNVIYPNQQLRIPTADEELAPRPLPQPVVVAPVQQTTRTSAASQAPSAATAVADGSVWDQLARCASGGNWAINTGNGYYGGLQFSLSSWRGVGGTGYPHQASREEQIARGEMLRARGGWGHWPSCSAKLGLR